MIVSFPTKVGLAWLVLMMLMTAGLVLLPGHGCLVVGSTLSIAFIGWMLVMDYDMSKKTAKGLL